VNLAQIHSAVPEILILSDKQIKKENLSQTVLKTTLMACSNKHNEQQGSGKHQTLPLLVHNLLPLYMTIVKERGALWRIHQKF